MPRIRSSGLEEVVKENVWSTADLPRDRIATCRLVKNVHPPMYRLWFRTTGGQENSLAFPETKGNSICATAKFSSYLPLLLPFLFTVKFLLDPWCRFEQNTGRLLSTQTRYRQSPSRDQRQLPQSSFFCDGPRYLRW